MLEWKIQILKSGEVSDLKITMWCSVRVEIVLHPAGFNLAKSTWVFLTKPQPVGASSEKLKLTWRQVDLGELPTGLFLCIVRV